MSNYKFGIEIEIVADAHHKDANFDIRSYYKKLAVALRKRGQPASADDGTQGYRKHPEHYDKWWITWDGSLIRPTEPEPPSVPFEAVSPVMETEGHWETQIDVFWTAFSKVFHMPKKLKRCGSHIHISKPNGFTLAELKRIAWCTIYHEPEILKLLPEERRDHKYSQPNSMASVELRYESLETKGKMIDECQTISRLIEVMQGPTRDDRYVLWNFANLLKPSRTIEFRGGRCLRGPVRTKRWIAFATTFIHFCLQKDQTFWRKELSKSSPSASALYRFIRKASDDLYMQDYLPKSYEVLNEEKDSDESSGSDSYDDLSDDASIVSKSLAPRHRDRFCVIL